MRLQPRHSLFWRVYPRAGRVWWSLNHNHRATQSAGRFQFWKGCRSARVFGDQNVNVIRLHHGQFCGIIKRPTRREACCVRGQAGWVRCINGTQQISMLRGSAERRDFLASGCQKNPQGALAITCRVRQQASGGGQAGHTVPVVFRSWEPRRAFQSQQRKRQVGAGFGGMLTHGCGKRVRGVNHSLNGMMMQPVFQPLHASKSANSYSNIGQMRVFGHASQRECGSKSSLMLQKTAQARSFRRAAQNQHGQGRSGGRKGHEVLYPEGPYGAFHSDRRGGSASRVLRERMSVTGVVQNRGEV